MDISTEINKEMDNGTTDAHDIAEIVARKLNVSESEVLEIYDLMSMDN